MRFVIILLAYILYATDMEETYDQVSSELYIFDYLNVYIEHPVLTFT